MWMNQQRIILTETSKLMIAGYDIMEGETRQKRSKRSHYHCDEMRILFMVKCGVQNVVLGMDEKEGQGC